MLIDWFTVAAQVVNFLILVWLLKHFLYQPILDAIDAREKRIADELADADKKRADAQQERDTFQRKNEHFEEQRATLLTQATQDAQAEGRRLMEEARQASAALSAKRLKGLRDDTGNLHRALGRRAQQEVFAIARRALADLATTSLEESMVDVFVRRLRELDGEAKDRFAKALSGSCDPALLRSAFELPAEQRAALQTAINETFSADIPISFAESPDLISGIELSSNGEKIAWSIADYLASLEKGVDELLKAQPEPETTAGSEPQLSVPETMLP